MSHPREPIPQTCPQIDKIVGKIKYLNKQFPRHWSDIADLEKLQELAEEMQDILEDCNSQFELLRRSNEILRNWGEQEAVDCDKLEEKITCSATERAFLDEIREKGAWVEYEYSDESEIFIAQEIQLGHSTICVEDFCEADLRELVNE